MRRGLPEWQKQERAPKRSPPAFQMRRLHGELSVREAITARSLAETRLALQRLTGRGSGDAALLGNTAGLGAPVLGPADRHPTAGGSGAAASQEAALDSQPAGSGARHRRGCCPEDVGLLSGAPASDSAGQSLTGRGSVDASSPGKAAALGAPKLGGAGRHDARAIARHGGGSPVGGALRGGGSPVSGGTPAAAGADTMPPGREACLGTTAAVAVREPQPLGVSAPAMSARLLLETVREWDVQPQPACAGAAGGARSCAGGCLAVRDDPRLVTLDLAGRNSSYVGVEDGSALAGVAAGAAGADAGLGAIVGGISSGYTAREDDASSRLSAACDSQPSKNGGSRPATATGLLAPVGGNATEEAVEAGRAGTGQAVQQSTAISERNGVPRASRRATAPNGPPPRACGCSAAAMVGEPAALSGNAPLRRDVILSGASVLSPRSAVSSQAEVMHDRSPSRPAHSTVATPHGETAVAGASASIWRAQDTCRYSTTGPAESLVRGRAECELWEAGSSASPTRRGSPLHDTNLTSTDLVVAPRRTAQSAPRVLPRPGCSPRTLLAPPLSPPPTSHIPPPGVHGADYILSDRETAAVPLQGGAAKMTQGVSAGGTRAAPPRVLPGSVKGVSHQGSTPTGGSLPDATPYPETNGGGGGFGGAARPVVHGCTATSNRGRESPPRTPCRPSASELTSTFFCTSRVASPRALAGPPVGLAAEMRARADALSGLLAERQREDDDAAREAMGSLFSTTPHRPTRASLALFPGKAGGKSASLPRHMLRTVKDGL